MEGTSVFSHMFIHLFFSHGRVPEGSKYVSDPKDMFKKTWHQVLSLIVTTHFFFGGLGRDIFVSTAHGTFRYPSTAERYSFLQLTAAKVFDKQMRPWRKFSRNVAR